MHIEDHGKAAFICGEEEISYRELIGQIRLWSDLYDLPPGGHGAIVGENSLPWIYSLYSIWHKGGIAIPLDHSLDPEELSLILEDCDPPVIFCSAEEELKVRKALELGGLRGEVLVLEVLAEEVTASKEYPLEKSLPIPPHKNEDETALIMYTSGTTGRAKGVMLSFENLNTSIEGLARLKMVRKEDTLIGLLPFYHILPLQGLITAPMKLGATVVLVQSLVSEDILTALQRHRVTMFLGVPRLYELFHRAIMGRLRTQRGGTLLFALASVIRSQRFRALLFGKVHRNFGGHVHAYLTGGAKMEPQVLADLTVLGFPMVEGYGATETAPLIAFNPFGKVKPGSVGLPMAGTEVRIEDGEIVVKGANVMQGYDNNREATAAVLHNGWYHTGDMGHFDDDGYLYVTGRKDDMIVLSNGENINPEEVERSILHLSPYIEDVGVMELNGQLAAFVYPNFEVFRKENIINIFETIKWKVIEKYNGSVAAYRRILNIKMLKEPLPKTRLGKVKRFMLEELLQPKRDSAKETKEVSSPEEEMLISFLSEMKGMEVYGEDHIEIDLGLDSLDKIELVTFIETSFGLILKEDDLAGHQRVDALGKLICEQKRFVDQGRIDWGKILREDNGARISDRQSHLKGVRRFLRAVFDRRFHLQVQGLANLPEEPFILVSNHQSYLDVPFMLTHFPDELLYNTFFLVKESRFMSKIVKAITFNRNILIVNIDRDLKGTLQRAAKALEAGKNVVIFPEGVRSRDGSMGAFKKLFAILSREMGVPVVPMAIRGAYEAMPYGKFFPARGSEITVAIEEPVFSSQKSYGDMAEQIEGIIREKVYPTG